MTKPAVYPAIKWLTFIIFSLHLTPGLCQDSLASAAFLKGMRGTECGKACIYYPVPFKVKSVELVDNRPDTVILGFYKSMFSQDCFLILNRKETLQQLFDSLLTGVTNNARVKIVLNHFYITNPPFYQKMLIGNLFPCVLTINAKLYIQQDGYWQGLFKADTTFFIGSNIENNYKDLFYNAGLYLSKKLQQVISTNSFVNHPKLSNQVIDSINRPVRVHPLPETDTTGFFVTFNDFLHGRLTKAEFTLSEVQDGLFFAYSKYKNEAETLVHNVWGVVKNGKTYIMRYSMLMPLIKIDNGYYWKDVYGGRDRGVMIPFNSNFNKGADKTGAPKKNTSIKYFFKSSMLNMQNGGSY